MSTTIEVLKDPVSSSHAKETFALDVLIGLTELPKRLSSKYFYDTQGSRLFQSIMELPEYYLTRCEFEILQNHKEEIAGIVGNAPFNLIELGPGDAKKTRVLMDQFLKSGLDFQYVPIDISESAMQELVDSLNGQFPRMNVYGLVSDYLQALNWMKDLDVRRNVVLFLGSNIGNFNRAKARVFLRSLWNSLNGDDLLLIGFDLKKDIDLLLHAYNDSSGVTREFNHNLLRRINVELGGNFDLSRFRHYGTYNVFSGAMESYLVSLEKQMVFVREIGQSFSFDPWEPIHTEYSYKYLGSDILKLADETGFFVEKQMYDSRCWFNDCIWSVKKEL